MSRRLIAAIVAAGIVLSFAQLDPSQVDAGKGRTTPATGDGSLLPVAGLETSSGGRSGGGGDGCDWVNLRDKGFRRTSGDGSTGDGDYEQIYEGTREAGGQTLVLYSKTCPPPVGYVLVWVPPVDMAALRTTTRREVEKKLPAPALSIAPDAASGGLIRLQTWLAVEGAEDVTAEARVGPVWIRMTATQASLTWTMGDGGTVNCDGIGTPAPAGADLIQIDGEAPCGYAYPHVSAPQFGANAALAYENNVMTTWDVTWVDYTGATGTANDPPLTNDLDWTYQVRQIQTVRVNGDD